MANAFSSAAQTTVVTARRRWVRRDRPVWPFVWRGLLPVLGLLTLGRYALESFARDDIQATVRHEVRAALDAQGMGWVQLDVSGQNVVLGGVQPAAGRGDAALLLARLTTCPSWLGRLPCTIDVSGRFADPAPATSASMAAPASTAAPASAPAEVSAAASGASQEMQAARASKLAQAARACEAELAAIVALSKIEFDPASATLRPGSAPVLAALAKAAADCPGVIRIEGHTDSTGEATSNQRLSEARAASVRAALVERGVAAERLRALGYGDTQPLTNNTSAEGRAKNRRIEFRIASRNP